MVQESGSRFAIHHKYTEQKSDFLREKSVKLNTVTEEDGKLKLLIKQGEQDKKKILDSAKSEQATLKAKIEREHLDVLKNIKLLMEKRISDLNSEIEKVKNAYESALANKQIEYNDALEENALWVENAQCRADEVDRHLEIESLKVKNLKDTLSIEIKTIEAQIKVLDEAREDFVKMSAQSNQPK